MKPKILIFSLAYHPKIGGAELAVKEICERISEFEFDLITCRFSKNDKRNERIGNVNIFRIGWGNRLGRYFFPLLGYLKARKLHREKKYFLVWGIMAAYAGAAAWFFVRKFPDVKFFLTLQEGDPVEHIHRQVRGIKRIWQQIFRRADYIQVISRYLADWARREGATCPIQVVPNGVDFSKFSISNYHVNKKKQRYVIITTSRLVIKNGVDILIRAAAELKRKYREFDFEVRIAGGGPDEQKLRELAARENVTDRITFLNEIEPKKIPQLLAEADLFVRPSRSEGLGSSFLEAMAAGLPVVGTPVGGIPDFLKDGETGLLCQPEDPSDLAEKIWRVASDAALANRLSAAGRGLAESHYSWDAIAQEIKVIFTKLHGT